MTLRVEFQGISTQLEPYVQQMELIDVDHVQKLLTFQLNSVEERAMTFELFNTYMKTGQMKLI